MWKESMKKMGKTNKCEIYLHPEITLLYFTDHKIFFNYRANTMWVLHIFKFDNRIDLDQTNAHKILLTALWLPHYTVNASTYTLTH